ncbi:MAG TPA: SDR family oxidoreductase [Candidatus Limnocylindria bacterium]|jgi:NAD(P)-dependent dehydrogenase (short-subunit alcohol dehydrogenase family)
MSDVKALAGIHVLLTGGAGDIGAAIASELASRGARLTLVDMKGDDDARPWLDRIGSGFVYEVGDIRDGGRVDEIVHDAAPFDIAIANAGIVESAPFLEITPEQWARHIDINLTGSFNVAQAAARSMVERGAGGRIIFTGSWVQEVPWPEIAAYSVSKAGIRMLARTMAKELAPHHILVNVLAPGIVNAGLARHQLETEPQYAARVATAIPIGSLQQPEQVAKAMAFLCSPDADYLTGSVLLADGGCSLGPAE